MNRVLAIVALVAIIFAAIFAQRAHYFRVRAAKIEQAALSQKVVADSLAISQALLIQQLRSVGIQGTVAVIARGDALMIAEFARLGFPVQQMQAAAKVQPQPER